jgi:S-DNA-T family DNA segregation ATPase FtsK/SpoIIIE
LTDLAEDVDGAPVIGVADDDLAALAVRLRSTFLVAGPPGSGRSTALACVAAAGLRSKAYPRAVYLGLARSPVHSWLDWTAAATDPAAIIGLATALAAELAQPNTPRTIVVLEAMHDVAIGAAEAPLLALTRVCAAAGHTLVTDVDLNAKMFSELAAMIKAGRQGLVLCPNTAIDGTEHPGPGPAGLRRPGPHDPGRRSACTAHRALIPPAGQGCPARGEPTA